MNPFFSRLAFSILVLPLFNCGLFPKTVKVGSKNTTTQMLIAEIAAQHLEAKGLRIVRRIGMGNTAVVHQATLGGDIDVYPEDTGTAIASVLRENPITDVEAQYERVRNEYDRLYGLRVIRPIGASNSPVAVVSESLAAKDNLSTISDAVASAVHWRLAASEEFSARADGMQAFSSRYRMLQKEALRLMDGPVLYQALLDGQVDMIFGNQSDGMLGAKGYRALRDDKDVFAPGQLCLLVRKDTAAGVPALEAALTQLSGRISTETMRGLSKEVEIDKRPLPDVARDFLAQAGLK